LLLAQQQAIDWIDTRCSQHTSLTWMFFFWVLMLISLAAIPLAPILGKMKLGGPTPIAH
jgi:MFS transporter, DHA2 family, multidrug resistance protein